MTHILFYSTGALKKRNYTIYKSYDAVLQTCFRLLILSSFYNPFSRFIICFSDNRALDFSLHAHNVVHVEIHIVIVVVIVVVVVIIVIIVVVDGGNYVDNGVEERHGKGEKGEL